MPRPVICVAGPLLAVIALATSAAAWQVHVGTGFGEDRAGAVAFLPDGDVVAGGLTERSGDAGVATVVRLTHGGRLAWKTLIEPRASQVTAVAVDGAGDVFGGVLLGGVDESDLGRFGVVALDGRTGRERWRHVDPLAIRGTLALDERGTVVIGRVQAPDEDGDARRVCSALDGATGTERWRREECGEQVAVLAGHDVVAAGGGVVRRLAGADGAETWRADVGLSPRLLRTGGGDGIVVADDTEILLLDGAGGSVRWRRTLDRVSPPVGGIHDVALGPSGDVIVAGGSTFEPGAGTQLVVVRLARATGGERWRTVLDGDDALLDLDAARAVGVDRRGDVLVAATLGESGASRVAVLALDGATGAVRWQRHARGDGGVADALALGAHGAIAVGGGLVAPGTSDDDTVASFLVLHLTGRALGPVRVR